MAKKQKGDTQVMGDNLNSILNTQRWKSLPMKERVRKATEIVNNIVAQRHKDKSLHTESDPHWKDRLFSHLVHGILTPENVGYELFGGGVRRTAAQ